MSLSQSRVTGSQLSVCARTFAALHASRTTLELFQHVHAHLIGDLGQQRRRVWRTFAGETRVMALVFPVEKSEVVNTRE